MLVRKFVSTGENILYSVMFCPKETQASKPKANGLSGWIAVSVFFWLKQSRYIILILSSIWWWSLFHDNIIFLLIKGKPEWMFIAKCLNTFMKCFWKKKKKRETSKIVKLLHSQEKDSNICILNKQIMKQTKAMFSKYFSPCLSFSKAVSTK